MPKVVIYAVLTKYRKRGIAMVIYIITILVIITGKSINLQVTIMALIMVTTNSVMRSGEIVPIIYAAECKSIEDIENGNIKDKNFEYVKIEPGDPRTCDFYVYQEEPGICTYFDKAKIHAGTFEYQIKNGDAGYYNITPKSRYEFILYTFFGYLTTRW